MKQYIVIMILSVCAATAVAKTVECFECSWVGGKKLDDERRKELDAIRKEQAGMSIPIHNPLASRYFEQITRPLPQNLTKNCNKCKLESGLCVRWTFLTNDIAINATYMCVQSAEEKGIFTQKMDGSLVKEVLICDTNDCNCSGLPNPDTIALFLATLFVLIVYNT